jgi:transposase-like protein
MERKKSMPHKIQKTYSESFKIKVVDEIEKGDLTQAGACRLYDLSDSSVSRWLASYGMNELVGKKVVIMTDREIRESDLLRKENKQLKRALEDSQFSNEVLEKYIQYIAEQNGIDLKKKINSDLSEDTQKLLNSRLQKGQE